MSLRLGIIGYPLTHTLSPFIHQAFLKQFGMPGSYEVLPCQKALDQIALAHEQGFKGLNVTIPHKVTVAAALGKLTVQAKLVGAVNTISFVDSEADYNFVDTAGGDFDEPDDQTAGPELATPASADLSDCPTRRTALSVAGQSGS